MPESAVYKSRLSTGVAHMYACAKGILQLQLYQKILIINGHLLFTFRITEQLDVFPFSLNFGPTFRFNFVHLFTHYFYFLYIYNKNLTFFSISLLGVLVVRVMGTKFYTKY